MTTPLDARETKPLEGGASFSLPNRAYRALWIASWFMLASWTPPFMGGWRRLLLRLFGAQLAQGCDVRGSARVWSPRNLVMAPGALIASRVNCYNMAIVALGERALVSQGAYLCASSHDIDGADFQLIAKPIRVGARAWIASEACVGPGATIGEGAVLGARGVAFRDLEPWTVYAGNPAAAVRRRKPSLDGERADFV